MVAAIQSWRGTKEELLSVIEALVASAPDESVAVRGHIGLDDARAISISSLDELKSQLEHCDGSTILTVRVDMSVVSGSYRAMIAVTPGPVGLRIEVGGSDRAHSFWAAQVAFQRMMIGYVDRLEDWRSITWMLSAIAPLLLFSMGLSRGSSSVWVQVFLFAVGVVGSFAVFTTMYGVLLVPGGVSIVENLPESGPAGYVRSINRILHRRWVRRVLAWGGVLLIGVAGNKVADLIPWP